MNGPLKPHAGQPVRMGGPSLSNARMVVVLAHGRGGSPEDMLQFGAHLAIPDITFIAPAAAGHSWWPHSFLVPIAELEPWLGSAISAFGDAVDHLAKEGIQDEQIIIGGFSQGACLALEYAARAGRAFRGIVGMSGGLVGTGDPGGPPRADLYGHPPKSFDYGSRVDGAQVYLGCHERDPHIPLARVQQTGAIFEAMGGAVTTRIHPGQGHGITEHEVAFLRGVLNG